MIYEKRSLFEAMDINNQYGLKECQQDLLKLMLVFDKLCNENNIVYSADSGTLLGAIRHDGFIPWDDDLDIVVDRKNYDKLMKVNLNRYGLEIVRKTFIESLRFIDNTSLSTHPILDVFTIDNTPDNSLLRKWKITRIMMVHGLWHHYSPMKYPKKAYAKRLYSLFFGVIGGLLKEEQIFRLFQKVSMSGNRKRTRGVQCFNYLTRELGVVYPYNVLDNVERHKFEEIEINVTTMYDTYLRALYGDYMKPVQTKVTEQ